MGCAAEKVGEGVQAKKKAVTEAGKFNEYHL